ncbi:putative leucine-rich repeat domain superfamily [Helianthus anomalus]
MFYSCTFFFLIKFSSKMNFSFCLILIFIYCSFPKSSMFHGPYASSKVIRIEQCHALSSAIPSYAIGQMQNLQELHVICCGSMLEVVETQGINNSGGGSNSTKIDEGNGGAHTTTLSIPKIKNINVPQLSGLKKLTIGSCNRLHHVFTFSTLESLRQLEELRIGSCKSMEVIVKKENGEQRKVVVFPRLKFLTLLDLPNLNGFFLGMNDFQWSLLEMVRISRCPQMIVFTSGQSIAPELKYIHTSLGKHTLDSRGLNFHVTRDLHQVYFQFIHINYLTLSLLMYTSIYEIRNVNLTRL